MIKYLIAAILAFTPQIAFAVTCDAGSAFELQRPSDGVALGCIDNSGNVLYGSSVTTTGTFFGDGSGLTGIPGGGLEPDTTTFSAVNYSTVTLTPGVKTCVDWNITMSATNSLYIVVNDNHVASNYRGNTSGRDVVGNIIADNNNGARAFLPLPRNAAAQTTASGEHNVGTICIFYQDGDNTDVHILGQMTHKNPSFYEGANILYTFNGTSDVTTLTFQPSSPGTTTMTGKTITTAFPE